jgi:hypothetical protein
MRRELTVSWLSGTVQLVRDMFSSDDQTVHGRDGAAPLTTGKDVQCDECDCDCYECRARRAVAN